MSTVYPEQLRAVMVTGAGDELTVQLHWQASGGLGLCITSPAFDVQRWPSPLDMIELGGAIQKLAESAMREGGGA